MLYMTTVIEALVSLISHVLINDGVHSFSAVAWIDKLFCALVAQIIHVHCRLKVNSPIDFLLP